MSVVSSPCYTRSRRNVVSRPGVCADRFESPLPIRKARATRGGAQIDVIRSRFFVDQADDESVPAHRKQNKTAFLQGHLPFCSASSHVRIHFRKNQIVRKTGLCPSNGFVRFTYFNNARLRTSGRTNTSCRSSGRDDKTARSYPCRPISYCISFVKNERTDVDEKQRFRCDRIPVPTRCLSVLQRFSVARGDGFPDETFFAIFRSTRDCIYARATGLPFRVERCCARTRYTRVARRRLIFHRTSRTRRARSTRPHAEIRFNVLKAAELFTTGF